MDHNQIINQFTEFNKMLLDSTLQAMDLFQDKSRQAVSTVLAEAAKIPADGKDVVGEIMNTSKTILENSTKQVGDSSPSFAGTQFIDYWSDYWQRSVLFLDVLRRRGNKYYEHRAMVSPHVLHFDAELVCNGQTLEHPVNYGLARIKPPEGVVIDPRKRPFVVFDPRAGHGPGIGGFKADSEIGMAMNAGHPCYTVGFGPEPMPGQTIFDIVRAKAKFLEKVIELHPESQGRPCCVGNCQAGWAIMMMAAMRPELVGPIIVAGAPLSYWAGIKGKNPMRYSGGLLGGSWLTALTGDIGHGKFDGVYLVNNFENLNPANTLWTKYYNLWSKVDTEATRFLEFETWWGGHVNLNAAEIQWIVDKLFIGNRLSTAEIVTDDNIRLNFRNIRSPIVCFCSAGDNITPPQQALGWIIDLYEKDEDVMASGQTIIYCIHKNIGHLGIFVSGEVARKEHEEFASNIDLIDVLPPGIYEAVMTPKCDDSANPELVCGDWITRFEPRSLNDIRKIVQPDAESERCFATVRRISEINLGLYKTYMQPFVRSLSTKQTARWLHKLNPAVLSFELFSDRNPFMGPFARLAEQVRQCRHQVAPGNPFVAVQGDISEGIVTALNNWRDWRDGAVEKIFLDTYSDPFLQSLAGLRASEKSPRWRPGLEPERLKFIKKRTAELQARTAQGGLRKAVVRCLVYIDMAEAGVDERSFAALRRLRADYQDITLEEFKRTVRDQFFIVLMNTNAALSAIPSMIERYSDGQRAEAIAVIREIAASTGTAEGKKLKRLGVVEKLFGVRNENGTESSSTVDG